MSGIESRRRTLAKAVTWQLLGVASTSAIAFAFTGSLVQSGSLAASASVVALVCYFLHERVWNRILWGRDRPTASSSEETR